MTVFEQMMSRYEIKTNDDYNNVLHETMQQIALAGLYRGGFFSKGAFYGGTCLRIFYNMQRFSEDMDFSLLVPDEKFSLEEYYPSLYDEFKSNGREVIITKKDKREQTNVESAFLKDDTEIYNLKFRTESRIKIKLEVDKKPPPGFTTEFKLSLLPFSFMTRCYSVSDLFAGKMHALLFRKWKTRVKGRDWYDFEWYVRNNIPLNFDHLKQRILQSEDIVEEELDKTLFLKLLYEKIENTNIDLVKNDVRPFIKDQELMAIWSKDYFGQLAGLIRW